MEPRPSDNRPVHDSDDDSDSAADVEKWEESETHFRASSPPMSSLLFENLENVGILEERVSQSPSPEPSHEHYGTSVYGRPSPPMVSPKSEDYEYAKASPAISVTSPMHAGSSPEDISHGTRSPPSESEQPSPYGNEQSSLPQNPHDVKAFSPSSPRSEGFSYGRKLDDKTPASMSPVPSTSPQLSDRSKISPPTSPLHSSGHDKGTAEGRESPETLLGRFEEAQVKEEASTISNGAESESLKTEVPRDQARPQLESKDTKVLPDIKISMDQSIRTPMPAFTQAMFKAAKKVSSTTKSFSSRSSPAIYGSTYGTKLWLPHTSSQSKIIEFVLRIGGTVLSLISFAIMASTSEERSGAGSTFTMKFHDFGAYSYLVTINVIFFLYSGWHLFQLGQPSSTRAISSSFRSGLHVYICDQMSALLLLSASSSAATASQLSRHGLRNIWPPACSTWGLWLFCSKADAAVVMSFFSSLFAIGASISSGRRLSRSFGD